MNRLTRAAVLAASLAALVGPFVAGPAEARPAHRPDGYLRIDGTGTDAWTGIGTYSASTPWTDPVNHLKTQATGTFKILYRIHNRGKKRDSFRILASRSSTPPSSCTYRIKRRGKNITNTIVNTGYIEKGLKPGDKTTYRVTIKAPDALDNCAIDFISSYVGDYNKRDHVMVTVASSN